MSKYRFIVGVSLADLENRLNQTVSDEPCLEFKQMLFVPGTGFVAIVEGPKQADNPDSPQTEAEVPEKKTRRSPQKSHQKPLEEIQKKNS